MYQVDKSSITFPNGKRHCFTGDIAEVVEFEEILVVRLIDDPALMIRNVFGLDYRGNIVWQIPAPVTFRPIRPYVSVTPRAGYLDALNWDGHVLTLHPKIGSVIREEFCPGDPRFTRRIIPARHWL